MQMPIPSIVRIALVASLWSATPILLHADDAAAVLRCWLTPVDDSPLRVAVSWESGGKTTSEVRYGSGPELGQSATLDGERSRHHVVIEPPAGAARCYYQIVSGGAVNRVESFAIPGSADVLKIGVTANMGGSTLWSGAMLREQVDLVLTAGDNITYLFTDEAVEPEDASAYAAFVDRNQDLLRQTLFLPALGNHDKQLRPRGDAAPPVDDPVYDIAATAYRSFFSLPGEGWKWRFDLPSHDLRLVALDINHVRDLGTGWQSCHDVGEDSEQFPWYRDLVAGSRQPYLVTVHNEYHGSMRSLAGGIWWPHILQNSMSVTGFGHFGERFTEGGLVAFNVAANGRGTPYPDSKSEMLHRSDNLLLLTFTKGQPAVAELKDLQGNALEKTRTTILPRDGKHHTAEPARP